MRYVLKQRKVVIDSNTYVSDILIKHSPLTLAKKEIMEVVIERKSVAKIQTELIVCDLRNVKTHFFFFRRYNFNL